MKKTCFRDRATHRAGAVVHWSVGSSAAIELELPVSVESKQLTTEDLRTLIRDVPDFPKEGILFRDITPLLADRDAFRHTIAAMAEPYQDIDHVVCIESRGFILGAPIAYKLDAGLVPVRKAGRLPSQTLSENYSLEYGVDTVEIHRDAIKPGERVLIVDDLLATGGTVHAAIRLVERLGASLVGVAVLVELSDLGGRDRLAEYPVSSLIIY